MKKTTFTLLLFACFQLLQAQPFVRTSMEGNGSYVFAQDFGDFNNDGFVDKVQSYGSGSYVMYKNNNGVFETFKTFTTTSNMCKFFDMDRDGDLDILLGSDIYKNNNNSFDYFTSITTDGTCSLGDYNRDGYVDILTNTHLYRNLSGIQFVDNSFVFPAGSVFFDHDMDGDLDILGGGNVYKNDNSKFSLFTTIKNMTNIESICDLDGDGDLDFISNNYLFENADGLYLQKTLDIEGAFKKILDFDMDGQYDIVTMKEVAKAGYYSKYIPLVYLNSNGKFSKTNFIDLFNNVFTYEGWHLFNIFDVDDDNDYDLYSSGWLGMGRYSEFHKNNLITKPVAANSKPLTPTSLTSSVTGNDVLLKWKRPDDQNHTLKGAITYDIRIGTTKTGRQVYSPPADLNTGCRLVLQDGISTDTLAKFKLPPGKYYWNVQSVDMQFAGSPFSLVDSFEVKTTVAPILKSVANYTDNYKRTPDFVWSKVSNAQSYEVQLCDTSNFISNVYSKVVTDTILVIDTLLDFNKTYYWRVATINGDKGGYSLPFTFKTTNRYSSEVKLPEYSYTDVCLSLLFRAENNIAKPVYTTMHDDGMGRKYFEFRGLRVGSDSYGWPSFSTRNYSTNSWISNYTDPRGITLSASDYNNDNQLDYMGNYVNGNTTDYLNWNSTIPNWNKSYIWSGSNVVGLVKNGFTPVRNGTFEWADYDNDGDKDVIITGAANDGSFITQLYRNNLPDTAYTKIVTLFPNLIYSDAKWFDYNNDGYIDLYLSGLSEEGLVSKIFTNNNGVFSDSGAQMPGLMRGKSAVGDLDNDGKIELIISGNDGANDITKVYKYTNNQFLEINTNLPGVSEGSISLGDLNNDGTLDIAICGKQGLGYVTKVYYNRNMVFDEIQNSLKDISLSSPEHPQVGIADMDGDADMDILVSGSFYNNTLGKYVAPQLITNNIYKDGIGKKNTAPLPPSNIKVTRDKSKNQTIISWSRGSDAETPTKALSYNIMLGTSPNNYDIISPLADSISGSRKIVSIGNCQLDTFCIINGLKDDNYYVSVQSIDNNYVGSAFSNSQHFVIGEIATISVDISPKEMGTVVGAGSYIVGKNVKLEANPIVGCKFMYWKEGDNILSTDTIYNFTISKDIQLTAYFAKSYKINLTSDNPYYGSVQNGGDYPADSTITIEAIPKNGYVFSHWSEGPSVVSNKQKYTFKVTSNRELVANFRYGVRVNLESKPINGGAVNGEGAYSFYFPITIEAIPNTGYKFVKWMEKYPGGELTSDYDENKERFISDLSSYTFNLTFDPIIERTYVAYFEEAEDSIKTSSNPSNGGVTTGDGKFSRGTTQTVTATANTGYKFKNWTENGIELSIVPQYAFTVAGNRNLIANFIPVTSNPELSEQSIKIFSLNNKILIEGASGWNIRVCDINGKTIVFKKFVSDKCEIGVLPSGVYIVWLSNNENLFCKKQIVCD